LGADLGADLRAEPAESPPSRWPESGRLGLLIGLSPLMVLSAAWRPLISLSSSVSEAPLSRFEGAWASGALISELSLSSQAWRLWSAPLAHASWAHLSSNLIMTLITALVAQAALGWRGYRRGLRSGLLIYQSALLCFALRASSEGGWSLGLSGGVLALMGLVAAHLQRDQHPLRWLWAALCLYCLSPRGGGYDLLVHLLGLGLGVTWGLIERWALLEPWRQSSRAYVVSLWALVATHLMVLTWGWSALRAPGELWSSWRAYPQVAELAGPALGNGLCFMGPLSAERAQAPPWSEPELPRSTLDLSPQLSLELIHVSAEASAALVRSDRSTQPQEGLICLSPLQRWPREGERRRWLLNMLTQLESARAHIKP